MNYQRLLEKLAEWRSRAACLLLGHNWVPGYTGPVCDRLACRGVTKR